MAHGPAEGHAPRTVPERLSELAPPWQLQRLQEMMKGGQPEWGEGTRAGSRFLRSDAGANQAHVDAWYEPSWALYQWQPPAESQAPPPRGAGVSTFARRLMALERSRMRRSTGVSSRNSRPRTPSRVS
jgi:hypothetical protein